LRYANIIKELIVALREHDQGGNCCVTRTNWRW